MKRRSKLKLLLNPKRWRFFFSIVGRIFTEQETMFGHYGTITVRVPADVAYDLAFTEFEQ